jgi:hypothetical protein
MRQKISAEYASLFRPTFYAAFGIQIVSLSLAALIQLSGAHLSAQIL